MALLGFQFAEIKTIGSVHQINGRQNQQRRLPSDMRVQEIHQPGRGRSHHVVRKRPQVTIGPHFCEGLVFGYPDDHRHGCRVAAVMRDCGHEKREWSHGMENVNDDQLISAVCDSAGDGYLRDVENELDRLQLARRPPIKLRERARKSDQQGFRQT